MNKRVTSREEILDTAMEIAKREGIDGVSIRKIATARGISIGSIYNYYKDKESLNQALAIAFWDKILENQEMVYQRGMGFVPFLAQYYNFLYARLSKYDKSWLKEMNTKPSKKSAMALLLNVLSEDRKVNAAIWNLELTEPAFCEYVLVNLFALLRTGEDNCRFFLFLLEHLLYQ